MLDILKPPTDNLYKFIALTGLLLLVVSVMFPGYVIVTLELKRLEARKELNVTKAELEETHLLQQLLQASEHRAEAASKGLEAALVNAKDASTKNLKELNKAIQQLEKAKSDLEDATKDYAGKADAFHKQVSLVTKRTLDNEYQSEVIDSIDTGVTLSILFLTFGGIAGILTAITGFTFWYRKVQVFEDKVLAKAAATALEKDSDKSITETG